jgi:hypothetical protein
VWKFFQHVNELVRERPELAWLLILDLVRAAKRNQRFRYVLRGTWGNKRMPRAVYLRKERACADIPPY